MRSWIISAFLVFGFSGGVYAQIPERNQDPANPCTYNPSCVNDPARQLPDYPYDPTPDPGINQDQGDRTIYPDRDIRTESEFGRQDNIKYDDRALDDPYSPNVRRDEQLFPDRDPENIRPDMRDPMERGTDIDRRDDMYRRDEGAAGRDFGRGLNDF